jgi:hypothetical protein
MHRLQSIDLAMNDSNFLSFSNELSCALDVDYVAQFLHDECQKMLENPYSHNQNIGPEKIKLTETRHFEVYLEICEENSNSSPGPLVTNNHDFYLRFLGRGRFTLKRYHLPPMWRADRFHPEMKLTEVETSEVTTDAIFSCHSENELLSIEKVQGQWLCLSVRSRRPVQNRNYVWNFNRDSLQAEKLAPMDVEASRLKIILNLLKSSHDRRFFELVAPLCDHPEYSLRWTAAQYLLITDLSRALPFLKKLLADEHPEVRRAADKTYQALDAKGILYANGI